MSMNEFLERLITDGWAVSGRDEVKTNLFCDVDLTVWSFKKRITTHIGRTDEEPIFLPSLSSEDASMELIAKIINLKNLLLSTEVDSTDW